MPYSVDQLGLDTGEELRILLERYYLIVFRTAFRDAAKQVGVQLAFDVELPQVQQALGELLKLAKSISETTKKDIAALIGEAAAEGWSNETLAAKITERAASISLTRANIIAATETANAYSIGSIIAYEESGVVSKLEWLTAEDEKVCPVCGPLNGKQVKIGEEFAPGISYPAAHPLCRCTLLPVVDGME